MGNKLCQISDDTCKLPYKLLQKITNNFSEERKLGRGAFGQVYKGVFENGEEIAVKILQFMWGFDNDQLFQNEFEILKRLDHENIVRLRGFCDELEEAVVEQNGEKISCWKIHRALCTEYMPNGNLTEFLSGEYIWPTRYRIIKGICEGLNYLHEGLDDPILHLDLKPDNILLDQNMMPKIADFGISRLIGEECTKRTLSSLGTLGYRPPEFMRWGVISREYDIFSLGVIITKIIVGPEGYSSIVDTGSLEFTDHLYSSWKNLQEISKYASVQPDYSTQVRGCIEIAVKCMDKDRLKRPKIKDVISTLNEIEQQSQQNQLQGSQYNIMPQVQAQPMPQQPSLQQKVLNFANKLIQQIIINLQMQYIQEQRGLQEVASNRLRDMKNRRTTEWASGMCGPRGSGLFSSGLNW